MEILRTDTFQTAIDKDAFQTARMNRLVCTIVFRMQTSCKLGSSTTMPFIESWTQDNKVEAVQCMKLFFTAKLVSVFLEQDYVYF